MKANPFQAPPDAAYLFGHHSSFATMRKEFLAPYSAMRNMLLSDLVSEDRGDVLVQIGMKLTPDDGHLPKLGWVNLT